MRKIQSVTVFCGGHNGENPIYAQAAAQVGKYLAKHNITLIFGGSSNGLMGVVSEAAFNEGGQVVGIIPNILKNQERAAKAVSALIWTENITIRKEKMIKRADAFIILPGGFGTMDELFEVLDLNQIHQISKPVILFNIDHYYDALATFINTACEQGLLTEKSRNNLTIIDSMEALEEILAHQESLCQ